MSFLFDAFFEFRVWSLRLLRALFAKGSGLRAFEA